MYQREQIINDPNQVWDLASHIPITVITTRVFEFIFLLIISTIINMQFKIL
jgi:hypothetical protein